MKQLEGIAIFLLLAGLPFQDCGLQNTPLRTLGASLSVFPAALLLCLALARRMARVDLAVPLPLLLCGGYALLLSSVYLVLFGTSVDGANLIVKTLNLFVILGLYFFVMFGLRLELDGYLRAGAMCGLFFTVVAVLVGTALDGNGLLHATAQADVRPRGFCTESSTFSVQVVTSGLLAAYAARGRWLRGVLLLVTAILLFLSGSKGGLFTLLICAAVFGALRAGLNVRRLLLGAVLLVPLGATIVGQLTASFERESLREGTSVATRASMAYFAVESTKHNPLGVGFSGYYPALHRYLPAAMQSSRALFDFPLIFSEVTDYQYTTENAGCKTFFLDMLVYFGWPFAAVFFYSGFQLSRRLYRAGQGMLVTGVLFCFIALLTYYSSVNTYSVPVFLALCFSALSHDRHPNSLRLRAPSLAGSLGRPGRYLEPHPGV